jgi:peptidoglycan/LPS O-acetylase OafA/YrhL
MMCAATDIPNAKSVRGQGRASGLDALRLLAVFGVVTLYLPPSTEKPIFNFLVHVSGRWGVPFFFTLADFYFAATAIETPDKLFTYVAKRLWRLFIYTILAAVLYCLLNQ